MGKISPCELSAHEILRLNAAGIPRKAIAESVGLTFHCVQAWLQRRKAPSRPHSQRLLALQITDVAECLDLGMTHLEIAARFGVSESCVERTVARSHLQSARTGPRGGAQHRQRWSGGRYVDKHGYVLVFVPMHPQARLQGYVFEHRLVCEVMLQRYLLPAEVIDHLDGHPRHNWPSNLRAYPSNKHHLQATLTGRLKPTQSASIPGAYRNTQKLGHCPSADDTLARCTARIRARLERHISIHRTTTQHRTLPRRSILRSGALLPPFQ